MSYAAQDDDDEWPETRFQAFLELVLVTPFTVARRVLNVVMGPRWMRRLGDWIDSRGGSCD